MRTLLVTGYLALVASSIQAATTCNAITENKDYPGNDLGEAASTTADGCCDKCGAFSGCKAWVWVARNGGICLLKSGISGSYTYTGARASSIAPPVPPLTGSCPVIEANTDYPGNDITRTQRASIDLCCNDCEATPKCARFVYYNGDCILKSAGGSPSTFNGAKAATFYPKGSGPTPVPTPLQGVCSTIYENTDFPGNDIATTTQPSADLCCNDCYANPQCKAYVWNPAGYCILKSDKSTFATYTGARAAIIPSRYPTAAPMVGCSPIQEDTDYPGNDITITHQPSAELCCGDCTNTPGCRAFVWGPSGICYLKTLGGSPEKSLGNRAAIVPPNNPATCSAFENDVDYPGNDITQTYRVNAADCCQDCADTPHCTLYVWSDDNGGTCYLKDQKGDQYSYPGAKAGVYTRKSVPIVTSTPSPATSNVFAGTYGSYPSPTIGYSFIALAKWIPNSEAFGIGTIDITKPFPLPSPEDLIKSHDTKPAPLLEATTNTYYFPLAQTIGECAIMVSTSGYNYFTYVSSTQICVVHDFSSTTALSYGMYPGQNPSVMNAAIPTDFQIGQTNSANLAACQTSCLSFANCASVSYSGTTCTYFGPVATQAGIYAGWVVDPIVWNEVAGSMQYVTMPKRSISTQGFTTTTASSIKSVSACATSAKTKNVIMFSYDSSKSTCTYITPPKPSNSASLNLQLFNYPTSPAKYAGYSLPQTTGSTHAVNAGNADDCQKLCVPSISGCFGTVFDSSSKTCTHYVPSYSATITIGWIAPDNLPKSVANPTAVNFFVNAHQDDHELFMATKLYDSFASLSTKIVMIYTSAGDAGATDGWWQAREQGTIASAQSFIKLFGLFSPVRTLSTATINGHVIQKVSVGNAIHYFLRLSEAGMTSLPSKATSPIDKSTEKYANLAALTAVVISIMKAEAAGIGNAVVNSQQFNDVDHVLHAMTGKLVSDGVKADSTLSKCLTQNYFWGYQHWLDSVNMIDPSLSQQRTMWWALHSGVVKQYPGASPWYDHCEVLGRQYLASTAAGSGTC
ncbi:hypothetical protein THRCLA_04432 [Thraustotheca clavata]|uniref:Secreted protein n=1 Tax=Thraustotheca clavata TaxID=74557 RepID=A0A0A7CM83_9STRA|nr:secreted protein [Thraustotheca clavata]OQS03281.1 hypothetical protein THRCLA_04432 [Thraustotheca clavata]